MRPLLVLLALSLSIAVARGSTAGTSLADPSPETAAAVAALVADQARPLASDWKPQAAPGSSVAPAADARPRWMLLQGWTKIVVPDAGGAAPAPQAQELPDGWPRERNYQRAWYVVRVDLGVALPEALWLVADAVAHQGEVFVNGRHVGHHLGGYTPFEFDVTAAVRPGVNVVALFVRDEHAVESAGDQRAISQLGVTHPGGFTSAAGIRGGIFLEARGPVHVERVLVQTSTRKNEIRVSTWLRGAPVDAVVTHAVYAWPDGMKPELEFSALRTNAGGGAAAVSVSWRDARRWSPEHPNLYTLRTTVHAGGKSETIETRFGFREFWVEGKNFVLNGTPIRLLGTSVARDLGAAETPEVGRRYGHDALAYLKRELNYRAMRLHASIHPRPAVEAADEVGVLLINQSSIWSAMGGYYQRGGEEFMRNMEREFREWFWRDANAPSVVIWDVENEMIRDVRTPERERWVLALDRFIKQLDPTRIVEHSGAAWYSPAQETIHVHMQEQYSAVLRDLQREGRVPLVLGEFWAGGRGGETRLPNGYEFADRLGWLQEESRIYREKILEMRNYGASGVMPFWLDRTALGRTNPGTRRSYDPQTDEIFRWPAGLRNLGGQALSPVIAFAWPRGGSLSAGAALQKEIVVCNDREEPATFNVACEYVGQRQQWQVTLAPAAQDRHQVSFAAAASGELVVTIADSAGRAQPGDTINVHAIASPAAALKLSRRLVVMPSPSSQAAAALRALGVVYETASEIPRDAKGTLLLVPPAAPRDALGRSASAVRRYLAAGGRLLVLNQTESPAWLPITLPFWPAMKKSAPEFTLLGWPASTRYLLFSREVPLYAPGHPAFAGLTPADFNWWNAEDGRIADDAWVRPGAVDMRAGGPYRVLVGATRRENASVIEASFGEGVAVFCQLQVLDNCRHPAARALALNLLQYLDGPAWRLTENAVGFTGDITAARLATLTGLARDACVRVTPTSAAPRVVLAGDRAEPALLDALVREGRTVIVFSRDVAGRLPGYAVSGSNRVLAGTRAGSVDDALFWGVASGSFAPLDQSPAKGVLTTFPAAARIALGGISGPPVRGGGRNARGGSSPFERMEMLDGDKPIAVVEPRGRGRLVVTTIEPWNAGIESHRQLLCTILANAGVTLPAEDERPLFVAVKATVPPQFDGRLDDWTNDMEDRNVSPFQHATPIVLGGRDAVAGNVASDAELSGVLYLLHDATTVYVGGIVFSRDVPRVEVDLAGHKLAIEIGRPAIALDGGSVPGARIVTGRQLAREVSDTRLLSLTSFNAQISSLSPAIDAPGRTFEAAVPIAALGLGGRNEVAARVRLMNTSGAILQTGSTAAESATLTLRFERL